METLLEMSVKEISRLEVMQRLDKKQMSQKEAGTILALSTRQIKRLLQAYRATGARGLVSKRRGRPSHNRLSENTRRKALDLLKTKYPGFGPTLAHEKLVEKEKLQLSKESVLDKHQHFAKTDDRRAVVESPQSEEGCGASTARATRLLWGVDPNGWLAAHPHLRQVQV